MAVVFQNIRCFSVVTDLYVVGMALWLRSKHLIIIII